MAERSYFFIDNGRVGTGSAVFEWFPGFAVSQKQKSVASLHRAIEAQGRTPLEVSTKSPTPLGRRLSAFTLMLGGYRLENQFQAGKVFSGGGPYEDLLHVAPRDAKRDERLRNSGRLVKFTWQGEDWPLEPKTAFYDRLYYLAVRESLSAEELEGLKGYDAFTDIEFNPNRSLNTQARSAALVKLLLERYGGLPELDPEAFLRLHRSFC